MRKWYLTLGLVLAACGNPNTDISQCTTSDIQTEETPILQITHREKDTSSKPSEKRKKEKKCSEYDSLDATIDSFFNRKSALADIDTELRGETQKDHTERYTDYISSIAEKAIDKMIYNRDSQLSDFLCKADITAGEYFNQFEFGKNLFDLCKEEAITAVNEECYGRAGYYIRLAQEIAEVKSIDLKVLAKGIFDSLLKTYESYAEKWGGSGHTYTYIEFAETVAERLGLDLKTLGTVDSEISLASFYTRAAQIAYTKAEECLDNNEEYGSVESLIKIARRSAQKVDLEFRERETKLLEKVVRLNLSYQEKAQASTDVDEKRDIAAKANVIADYAARIAQLTDINQFNKEIESSLALCRQHHLWGYLRRVPQDQHCRDKVKDFEFVKFN